MPFVSVVNLGCRVNRVESDRMTADLVCAGFALVDEDDADLVVINTCAVTGEAEAKTRKAVRHAANLPRQPYVIVTGCVVNLHPDALTELSPRVIAEPMKSDVARTAARVLDYDGGLWPDGADAAPDARDIAQMLGRSRLGIKIQDGCNNRCTYCIVWKARGPERSVPVDAVLAQVREAIDAGVPEVVLTGVNLGAYDAEDERDAHVEIDDLLDRILTQTDIPHVRLSSIEPMDVSERLICRMAASPARVAPFLHLPVQSGCTATLERMGRPYTAEEFERTVASIRAVLPQIAISGDLIVGFPGETDEEFEQTRAFVERVGFSRLHVFRYSARPGTIAADMSDQVPPEVMAERSAVIRGLVEQTARRDREARVGTVERAVIEYPGRGTLGSFHRVRLDGADDVPVASLVDVAIMYMDEEGELHGRIVPSVSASEAQ